MTPAEQQAMLDRLGAHVDERYDEMMAEFDPDYEPPERSGPEQHTSLLDVFADKLKSNEPDGPYIEQIGRRISRAEAQELLSAWNSPFSPYEFDHKAQIGDVELNSEAATKMLEQAAADMEAEDQRRQAVADAERRAVEGASRHGRYTRLGTE